MFDNEIANNICNLGMITSIDEINQLIAENNIL